jgi:hypothetical protein
VQISSDYTEIKFILPGKVVERKVPEKEVQKCLLLQEK